MTGRIRSAVLAAIAVGLAGCGSDGSPAQATPPTTTAPGPTETVVAAGTSALRARTAGLVAFETTASGTLDATVDWTDTFNEVDVYMMRGPCTGAQWNANQCAFMAWSESREFKPERLRMVGVLPGSYVLAVVNRGPGEESIAFQVVLTTSGLRGQ